MRLCISTTVIHWRVFILRVCSILPQLRYGLEYDLDVYNIVAVNDFNMGAMENKGLNVFNTALTLAKPSTATDADYERIESVVGASYNCAVGV